MNRRGLDEKSVKWCVDGMKQEGVLFVFISGIYM